MRHCLAGFDDNSGRFEAAVSSAVRYEYVYQTAGMHDNALTSVQIAHVRSPASPEQCLTSTIGRPVTVTWAAGTVTPHLSPLLHSHLKESQPELALHMCRLYSVSHVTCTLHKVLNGISVYIAKLGGRASFHWLRSLSYIMCISTEI